MGSLEIYKCYWCKQVLPSEKETVRHHLTNHPDKHERYSAKVLYAGERHDRTKEDSDE